ncbi:MAG: YigZ family protein [Bacteroidales bacterium]|jgi:uncharacterized YigZ family protein|nr:YigZ family protein [Bacteroidales bacterium]
MIEYRTIQQESQGLYKEKGSRFIAVAVPAGSLDEVKAALEKLRKQYHDARHHCYAYRIGEVPYESRYQDDGEPSGTAGKPIYGQIQSFELTDILIVVIRYFGGVKLGTGGLIQAYRAAARDAIENSIIIPRTFYRTIEIRFDYVKMNTVMKVIKDESLHILRQDSGEQCSMLLQISTGNFDAVIKKISLLNLSGLTVI